MPDHPSESTAESDVETPASPAPPQVKGGGRRKILQFASLFVIYVLVMLSGYRYSVNTELNMWYLYKVASHTAMALGVVGDVGKVEPDHGRVRVSPQEVRKVLSDLRGEKGVAAGSVDSYAKEPLSPWEKWLYRAYGTLEEGGTLKDEGPIVYFMSHEGLNSKLYDVRQEIANLRYREDLSITEKDARRDELMKILPRLRNEHRKASREPGGLKKIQGSYFQFKLVPDCGAIPSMSIFVAAVLAFPTLLWKRMAGVAGGVVLLYGVNVFRLTMVAMIGAADTTSGLRWFNFAHEYVWQGIFIVFVVAIWMAWIEFVVRRKAA